METLHTAEIQGPYGPLAIPEQVVQQIWHEQKFLTDQLIMASGHRLDVLFPGTWNHCEGPDFRNARLRVSGEPVAGDVEIHFHARDWRHHGHDSDPEFNRVVLHVVLFPGVSETRTEQGFEPYTLVLLPHLEMDMEQYLLDFHLARMEQSGTLPMAKLLDSLTGEAFLLRLAECAQIRWCAKRDVMHNRLQGNNWSQVCHQTVLEAFGGRRNRAVFAKIALDYSYDKMRHNAPSAEHLYESQKGEWRLAGLRPFNHPKARLQQYLDLLKENPDWPQMLHSMSPIPDPDPFTPVQTSFFRKTSLVRKSAMSILHRICPRLSDALVNTLIADVFLPLLSAKRGDDLFPIWYHWHPGNFPESLACFLRHQCAQRGIQVPLGNGLQQGLLQLINEAKG
jgi:hypothetical protein